MDYTQAWDQQGGYLDFRQGSNFRQPQEKPGFNEGADRISLPNTNDGQKDDEHAFVKDMEKWGWLCEDDMLQYQKPTLDPRQTHSSVDQYFPQLERSTQNLTNDHMTQTAMFDMVPQSSSCNGSSHDLDQNQDGWQRNLHAMLETHLQKGLQRLGASTEIQEQAVVVSRQFHRCVDDWLRQPRGRSLVAGLLSPARSRPYSTYSQDTGSSFDTASFTSVSHSSQTSGVRDIVRARSQPQEKREYACTCSVCPWTSTTPYDWRRHEANHHRPYTCMPNGSHLVGEYCAICGTRDASERHKNSHPKLDFCKSRQISERSFRGIDKLTDHLKSHLSPLMERKLPQSCQVKRKELLESWYDTPQLPLTALWCGFCQTYLPNWSQRQEHVLGHIKDGRLKVEWMTERESGNEMEL